MLLIANDSVTIAGGVSDCFRLDRTRISVFIFIFLLGRTQPMVYVQLQAPYYWTVFHRT